MNKEYDKTPSFYNDEETFSKFLKKTSFYTALQKGLLSCISFAKPKKILEFGSATGETTRLVANTFPHAQVVGVDMRQNIVDVSIAVENLGGNVSFRQGNMVEYVKNKIDADFVYMLYSFHHILDPETNKLVFLKDLYSNLEKGAYVCIAEAFIPEYANEQNEEKCIIDMWRARSEESYASVFWNSFAEDGNVEKAKAIAQYAKEKEFEAGELVAKRDTEYLVKFSWLVDAAKQVGFEVVIAQPINNIADNIILLRK